MILRIQLFLKMYLFVSINFYKSFSLLKNTTIKGLHVLHTQGDTAVSICQAMGRIRNFYFAFNI